MFLSALLENFNSPSESLPTIFTEYSPFANLIVLLSFSDPSNIFSTSLLGPIKTALKLPSLTVES
jgi:hypothetical protein